MTVQAREQTGRGPERGLKDAEDGLRNLEQML